jgi:hypothetical protein
LHKLREADVPVVILVDVRHQLLDGLHAHPHPLPELEHFRELRHGEVPRGVHVEGGEELKVLLDLFVREAQLAFQQLDVLRPEFQRRWCCRRVAALRA